MGFRFRKSINLGGGFRLNLSKKGVGWSMGGKGVRYTHSAGGKKRVTTSIPGTGFSHVSSVGGSGGGKKVSRARRVSGPKKRSTALWLCILLGFLGVHRFYIGRGGSGLLWLFTVGLCGIGWIADIFLIASRKLTAGDGSPLL